MKKNIILAFAFAAVVIGVVGAYAVRNVPEQAVVISGHALFPELTKEELIQQSDAIVIGKVKTTESFKAPSKMRAGEEDVVTHVVLEVKKYLRNYAGAASDQITLEVFGGTAGNLTMDVEDTPSFEQGEEVLVFLEKNNDNTFSVYGWSQGKYAIDTAGALGIGEKESLYLSRIFGANSTLRDIETEIEAFKDVAPRPEIPAENFIDDKAMAPGEKNTEADSVLKN